MEANKATKQKWQSVSSDVWRTRDLARTRIFVQYLVGFFFCLVGLTWCSGFSFPQIFLSWCIVNKQTNTYFVVEEQQEKYTEKRAADSRSLACAPLFPLSGRARVSCVHVDISFGPSRLSYSSYSEGLGCGLCCLWLGVVDPPLSNERKKEREKERERARGASSRAAQRDGTP